MNFTLLSMGKSLLGLAILPDGWRMLQVQKRFGRYRIVRTAAGMVSDLAEWVAAYHLQGRAVALGVPETVVKEGRLQLPGDLTDMDIEAEIAMHLGRDFGGSEQGGIDFKILATHDNRVDIEFAAIRTDYLLPQMDWVQAAGLIVKIIDIDAYAIKRAIANQHLLHPLDASQMTTADDWLVFGLALREPPGW